MANICRTAPELWTSMLWSRRAMTADPKVRSVYDLSYAANAVLTRVSGPTSSCLKQLTSDTNPRWFRRFSICSLCICISGWFNWERSTIGVKRHQQDWMENSPLRQFFAIFQMSHKNCTRSVLLTVFFFGVPPYDMPKKQSPPGWHETIFSFRNPYI